MSQEIKEFIKRLNKAYTIPQMLLKILAVIRDENSPAKKLYELISHDQVIAERVITFANSAIFGRSGQIKDIDHAVLFLGYERIKSIALTIAVMDIFPTSRTAFNIKNLWIHSYEVAYLSMLIAGTTPIVAPKSEVFLYGLLHDIGRVILYRKDRERFFAIGTDENMFEREKELFGCTHAEAGAWYAEQCGIPEDIILPILYHHNPLLITDNRPGGFIVSLAEALSRRFSPKAEDDAIWTADHDSIIQDLRISEDDILSVGKQLYSVRNEIESFFIER